MIRRSVALLAGASALLIAVPSGASSVVTADELRGRLDRARALAEAGASAPSEDRMEAVRAAIGSPVEVELDDSVVSIPPDPVLAGLRGRSTAEFQRAVARIDVLRDALASATDADPLDRPALEAALEQAYREGIPVRPGIVERIRRAAGELLRWLLLQLSSFRGGGTLIAWAVLAALVALAVWLLMRLRLVPGRRVAGGDAVAAMRPVDARVSVEAAMRAGDLTAAVHAAYRLLLTTLARRGLLIEVPGLTAGEARAAARATDPELGSVVAGATDAFERVAYGRAPAGREDVEALLEAERRARAA